MNRINSKLLEMLVPNEISDIIDRIPKTSGSLGYDPWGYHPDGAKIGVAALIHIYRKYFRVETHGMENIPKEGRALVIANHSGQVAIDGLLLGVSLLTNTHGPRAARAMVERFLPSVPFLYDCMIRVGAIIGNPINCNKMLERGEVVIVFPEGVRGVGKPIQKRYQLQYMGTGFVRVAISTNSPIVPVGVVGCEETIISLGNLKFLAKIVGLPYVPVVIPFIFPSKVYLNYGKPIYLSGDLDNEEEMKEKVEIVKNEINLLIKKGLKQRKKA